MEKGLFCTMCEGYCIMGKLISLVKQPVLEHLTMYLPSECSSEMYVMEIEHCSCTHSWQCL